jgi:hypothetical protein
MRDGSVKVPIGMPDDDGSPGDHAMQLPCRFGPPTACRGRSGPHKALNPRMTCSTVGVTHSVA